MSLSPEPSCGVLRDVLARLKANRARLDDLLEGAGREALVHRPGPDAWSAAECLEHLRKTAALYRPRLERALQQGRERGVAGGAPYGRGTRFGRFLLGALDPARGASKPVPAPRAFRPSAASELDPEAVARGLAEENARLQATVHEADGLDLGRLRLGTPVLPILRLTVDQALQILAHHEARHLGQAERAVAAVASSG